MVISHNAFSDEKNNGKTVGALLNEWKHGDISQIYITQEMPSFSLCKDYFRITDSDILKSFISTQAGTIIEKQNYQQETNQKEPSVLRRIITAGMQKRIPLFMFMREMAWSFGTWKTQKLRQWIIQQKPDVVFYVGSNYAFANRIVDWVCQTQDIPAVMFITDNHHIPFFSLDPFYWIQKRMLIRSFEKTLCNHIKTTIAICDELATAYQAKFGGNYEVAMNCCEAVDDPLPEHTDNMVLVYTGNLFPNRWKSLKIIGEVLQELKDENLHATLSIYSFDEPESRVVKTLNSVESIYHKGAVKSSMLRQIRSEADILVHVEGFDRKCRQIMLYSMSTKIPEYLSSHRCMFAVVPSDYAEAKYLQMNQAAFLVTSDEKQMVKEQLRNILKNADLRLAYADRGLTLAKQKHNIVNQRELIKKVIMEAANKKMREGTDA